MRWSLSSPPRVRCSPMSLRRATTRTPSWGRAPWRTARASSTTRTSRSGTGLGRSSTRLDRSSRQSSLQLRSRPGSPAPRRPSTIRSSINFRGRRRRSGTQMAARVRTACPSRSSGLWSARATPCSRSSQSGSARLPSGTLPRRSGSIARSRSRGDWQSRPSRRRRSRRIRLRWHRAASANAT